MKTMNKYNNGWWLLTTVGIERDVEMLSGFVENPLFERFPASRSTQKEQSCI